ncbi:Rpp14/Pop5 family protein, partial [Aspergillus saccharolyticus JOP 1030-1]
MVRIKHRYLLLDILYPDPATWPRKPSTSTSSTQAQLQIHAPTSDALTPSLLAKLVREQVAELFGDWGVGRLGGAGAGGVSVKYLSPATSTAIIRCPRASFRLVWMALTCLEVVPEYAASRNAAMTRRCVFRVIRVSGTMRKAEEEAIRRARREVLRLKGGGEGDVLEGVLGGLVGGGGSVKGGKKGGGSEVDDVDVDVMDEDLSDDDD